MVIKAFLSKKWENLLLLLAKCIRSRLINQEAVKVKEIQRSSISILKFPESVILCNIKFNHTLYLLKYRIIGGTASHFEVVSR